MPVLVAEVNKSMSHIKTNGGSFPLPCQHLKTIQTAQMDKWFMLTRTKIGYAPFETFTEANLQRFTTWAKDEGHEMGCIYHLANFNWPNDQEAQAWSSHNISDLPSEEMSDSEQTNQTLVISLGRTALGFPSARFSDTYSINFRHGQERDKAHLIELPPMHCAWEYMSNIKKKMTGIKVQ